MVFAEKIENYQLWAIKILIFFIPFLPLYVSTSVFFPYIAGKNFAFRVLVEFAAALWLILVWFRREYRPQNSKILFSILLFTFIVGLANLFGVNPYKSFWSNFERMEGYITILHLALYFIILKSVLKTRRDWDVLLNLIVIAGTITGLYAIYPQASSSIAPRYFIEYGTRISGTIGNPPFLASYLLLVVCTGLILLTRTQKLLFKTIYLLTVLLNLIAIYLTASRGVILAVMIGIIILCLYYLSVTFNNNNKRRLKRFVPAFIVLLVILTIVILFFADIDFISKDRVFLRFASIFSDKSVETRLDVWRMALEGIKEMPVLGWGQENFLSLYALKPIPLSDELVWVDRAHNILIDWTVNAGLLGLIAYLAIFVSAVSVIIGGSKKGTIKKNQAAIIMTALAVYIIQNLFTFDTINTYMLFFSLLAYIDNIDGTEGSTYAAFNKSSEKRHGIYVCSIFIALLGFVLITYFVNYKPIRQSQITKQSSVILPEHETYVHLLNDFRRALFYSTFGDTYVRRQMASVANEIYHRKLFEQEGALFFIQSAGEELYEGVSKNRNDLKYLYGAIGFYQKINVYDPIFIDKTEALINACLLLNPDYQQLYMDLADLYFIKKDYEGAYAIFNRVLETDPENDLLQVKLARTAILTKRKTIAVMSIENVKNIRGYRNSQVAAKEPVFSVEELYFFAQAYKEVKDYGMAIKYYKEMLNMKPLNAQLHYEISEVYNFLGDKVNSMNESKRAAELAPGFYSKDLDRFKN